MKKYKIFTKRLNLMAVLLTAVLGLFIASCEDDEKNLLNDFEIGGFVRFAEPFPVFVDVNDLSEIPNIAIVTTLETPDNNVVSYTMEVSGEIAGVQYGPAPFGTEITTFPTEFTITAVAIASALEIDIDIIGFGDTFTFKGTAVNDKGIVYSSTRMSYDSSTQTISGSNSSADLLDEDGYRNALEFGFAIPCPPETGELAGDWIINFTDLYGDGWDGAFITVSIDGVATNYTLQSGAAGTEIVTVPEGTQRLVFSYTPGSWEEEHVYTVETPSGNIIGPIGPNPPLCLN